mmetsp:Transcript_3571/g.5535  ORF Transcript_3571/g.5535 Transcript_3571/m.5535 type:complete len:150 (-) Transcript_3571:2004-2453(-)
MSSGNSPALAGRFILAFVRLLRENFIEFQGEPRANCWWTSFSYEGFDPSPVFGFLLKGEAGHTVKILFVDNFLIQGPTYEKTCTALTHFLNTAVDCGFLFHPKNCTWPQQQVKYLGFLFETTGIPCLKIPVVKRERISHGGTPFRFTFG